MALDFPNTPTNGQLYTSNNITWEYNSSTSTWDLKQDAALGTTRVAVLRDQKNYDISGGEFYGDYWRDRDLTVIEDPSSFVTFVPTPNGQTTQSAGKTPGYWSLEAGTYEIQWGAGGFNVNRHQTRLVWSTTQSDMTWSDSDASSPVRNSADNAPNTTSRFGANECFGSSENGSEDSVSTWVGAWSTGTKVITITQTTYFKVLHISDEEDSEGFGTKVDSSESSPSYTQGKNIYAEVRIQDLATAIKEPTGTDIPVGGIIMYSGTDTELNALTNWKLCDGTTYGSVTTPNLKDKFVIGADQYSSGWKTNVTGSLTQSGGSKDAVVVQHNHTYVTKGGAYTGDSHTEQSETWRLESTVNTGDSGSHQHSLSGTTDSTGVAATNANLPPYFALAYIMRIS